MHNTSDISLIADHLALDFLNTSFGVTSHIELLNNDLQVYQWLEKAGIALEGIAPPPETKDELLANALELRNIASTLVTKLKNEEQADIAPLNAFLAAGSSYFQVVHDEQRHWVLKTCRRQSSAKDILIPVAEAIADLVVTADFSLIRQCENPECTLWFYDKTKSHQRRWCDMAICGNRMKAAAFRARKKNKSL